MNKRMVTVLYNGQELKCEFLGIENKRVNCIVDGCECSNTFPMNNVIDFYIEETKWVR